MVIRLTLELVEDACHFSQLRFKRGKQLLGVGNHLGTWLSIERALASCRFAEDELERSEYKLFAGHEAANLGKN